MTSAGVVSLVHTATQGNILGLGYFSGYLYYAAATKLGRIAEANASSEASWTSQNDSWGTFGIGDTAYKPMIKVGSHFLIGDGKYVAGVIGDTFYPNLLDVFTGDRITAIIDYGSYALIGTIMSTSAGQARIHLWDRYSSAPTVTDTVDERGVNMFIRGSNIIYINIGVVGNIYYWGGSSAVLYTKLVDGDNSVTTGVNPYGSGNLNGLPLINTPRGIFSLGRASAKLPIAQVIEYVSSLGQGVDAGALAITGSQMFVASKSGTTKVIDKISTNKYSGKIITPVSIGKLSTLKVFYSSIPTSTSISARLKKDNGSYASHAVTKDDAKEMCYRSNSKISNKALVQAEITLNASGTSSPSIYLIGLTKN
ncbi:MAG: hypothetical protein PHV59_08095 [Victivallales bacterium]|nr:hypothetical protein [Victivallales bacterium]